MKNLAIHIVLPRGFGLVTGAQLEEDVSFMAVGELDPYYTDVNSVRLAGGVYLSKIQDLTIAFQIFDASRQTRSLCYNEPGQPSDIQVSSPAQKQWLLWVTARQQHTTLLAAQSIIQGAADISMGRGSKMLGNFSVTRQSLTPAEGVVSKLTQIQRDLDSWKVVLKSGGAVGPGGHVPPAMAAKGYYDNSDEMPGRLWVTTGLGANAKSAAGRGSSGKPFKFSVPWMTRWVPGNLIGSSLVSVVRAEWLS